MSGALQGQLARVFALQDGMVLVLPDGAEFWLLRNGETVLPSVAVTAEAAPRKSPRKSATVAPDREAVIAAFQRGLSLAEARVQWPEISYGKLWSWSKAAEKRS